MSEADDSVEETLIAMTQAVSMSGRDSDQSDSQQHHAAHNMLITAYYN